MKRQLYFAVIIATRNRSLLLARRALASVAAQNRLPDIVVVVDDSDSRQTARNQKAIESFSARTGITAVHLSNSQCDGVAAKNISSQGRGIPGPHNRARNVGALHVLDAGYDPQSTYLSILDDDDKLLPHHLSQAEATALKTRGGVDFMPCAYTRREPDQVYVRTLPEFNGRDFLVGNPGVEGSTLIVRMSTFMRAGMFDDSLPASDDRDLCFRLSLLPDLSCRQPPDPSVIYYGDETRQRLTLHRGSAQLAGLSRFADKYRGWMSGKEYAAFCRRAKKLFGWTETKKAPPAAAIAVPHKTTVANTSAEKIALVVGIIVDPRQKNNPLFSDLLALSRDNRLSSTDIVVAPSSGYCRKIWRNEMEQWRRAGLHIHCVTDIDPEWRKLFGLSDSRSSRPIAVNRTILQHAVSRLAILYRNPVCWILDGDCRLHGLAPAGKKIISFRPDYVGEMARLRNSGCDIAIGKITGAAPLPRAFTARTQMVDLMHMLGRLLSSGRRHCPENIAGMDSTAFDKNYYHDCLLHPHLEQPLGIPPPDIYTADDFISGLPRLLERLLAGDWITRPLLDFGELELRHRGGNTLVFNPEILGALPNGFVSGELRGIRRQDEIWRIVGEKVLGKKISPGHFPVMQSREKDPPQAPDIARMADDIAGHAIVVALQGVSVQFDEIKSFVKFILRPESGFFDDVAEAARIRTNMVRASFFRIGGAAASMRALIDSNGGGEAAITALRKTERRFSEAAFAKIQKESARLLNRAMLRKTLSDFPQTCRAFATLQNSRADWIRNERKANATLLARRSTKRIPRFLGHGGEGAAFTDDRHVFKILHRWYSRADISDPDFLPSLAGKWGADSPVYPIEHAQSSDGNLMLTLPFEKTVSYKGGCGAGLTALLAAFKQHGIALWDMHPKNLRRKGNKVRLIDYGQHIHPFTARDFDLSTRKAWLCWRLADRDDLRTLLTASLTNKNMPELQGYEMLRTAVEQFATRARVADSVLDETVKSGARRILDYGCGKGKDAAALAMRGLHTDAYDPIMTKKAAARLWDARAHVIDNPTATGKYDVVIFRHVICEIFSDIELRRSLRDIRRLLAPNGRAIIAACDMHGLAQDTACARNIFSHTTTECKFKYRKLIRSTGGVRAHIHRPESMLVQEFADAGFRIVARRTFPDIDINRFEWCGGVLQWTLKPCPGKNS